MNKKEIKRKLGEMKSVLFVILERNLKIVNAIKHNNPFLKIINHKK